MLKKFIVGILAAVFAVMLAGCSEYEMTEEDLAIQRSIEGFWSADASTGYNSYDQEGNLTELIIVEFDDDFSYRLYECSFTENDITSYEPISYSFKNGKFKVDVDGVASYAKVAVSGDKMQWITDERTDIYNRMDEEKVRELGIPVDDGESTGS